MASPTRSRLILALPVVALAAVAVLAGGSGVAVPEPEAPDTASRTPPCLRESPALPPIVSTRVPRTAGTNRQEDLHPLTTEEDRLTVRILGPSGEPVPAGRVRVKAHAQRSGSRYRDVRRGVARFARTYARGRIDLEIRDARSVDGVVLGHRRIGPIDVLDRLVDVHLSPARQLTGQVVDEYGTPVSWASVSVRPRVETPGGFRPGATLVTCPADADGRFILSGLGATSYQLDIRPPGRILSPEKVWCPDWQSDVTVHLARR